MSLLPLLFSNWWEELECPHRVMDQDFGININPESLLPRAMQLHSLSPRGGKGMKKHPMAYYRPWSQLLHQGKGGGASTVIADKDSYRVDLDVQQFAPEEINVKVVDHFVIVEGKHEEKQDEHGWISRQFTRRYMVPEQCDIDQVSSKLSSDGVLSIIVPRKPKSVPEGERVINIEHTGKPAVCQAENEEKKPENTESGTTE
ncbi:protein lethal(2)essential for life-like isoform X1 [Osmia lignaria lignaria]|uniref:protein lethal(2)essential for life-like isoform X1 n=1 Tax=Osmia lignaria lignaria TaxID=1437193 RepID=UPI0014795418|nr:protein lethal(2)essential for life-like isoform X1 [Osmia lignaria]XP_034196471.1 protein lethal(2)essential for life-like isoform X1 [Osmia lignaria]